MIREKVELDQNSCQKASVDEFLPAHWSLIPLLDLCELGPTVNPEKNPLSPFTYVDVSGVSNESFCIVETKAFLGKNAPSRARKLIQTQDVIFATVRPTLRRVALVPPDLNKQVCSTAFCVLRSQKKRLVPLYLYFYLLSEQVMRKVEALEKGATYPAINDTDLLSLFIPLPPLQEQQGIAQTLQAVQQSIQARRREIELERARKAFLLSYVFTYGLSGNTIPLQRTKFGEIPAHWKQKPLEQCAFVQTGVAKGRKLTATQLVRLPYLRVANVQDGYLDLSEMKEIELRASEVNRYKLQPGDVVVTEGGDFDKLGRGFLWRGEIADCVHQNHIFAVRVNQELLLPEYFAYLIQSDYGRAYFLSVAHRTTNLASINSTKLKNFPTLLPSLEEQKEIVHVLASCDAKATALDKELVLLEELFHALLEDLMTGRISTIPLIEKELLSHE